MVTRSLQRIFNPMRYTGKHTLYDNLIDSNHGKGTQSNKYFKVFKKHRVSYHLLTLPLTMVRTFCVF